MVADGIHVLLGMALVSVVLRARRPEPYIVAALAAALPDIDIFLLDPRLYGDIATSILWAHRGLTHSLLAFVVFVIAAWTVGQWRAAALGYGSHVLADAATGGTMLFVPVSAQRYGFHLDWMLVNVALGILSILLIVGWLFVLLGERSDTPVPDVAHLQRRALSVSRWLGNSRRN